MMSWACLALGRFVCAISERRHRAVGAIRRWVAQRHRAMLLHFLSRRRLTMRYGVGVFVFLCEEPQR